MASQSEQVFLFAAKTGSLEGYLYQRDKVEPLTNWVDNINRMYHELPPGVREEVNPSLVAVLKRTLEYGQDLLEPELKGKLRELLQDASEDLTGISG